MDDSNRIARIAHGLVALTALVGIALHYAIVLSHPGEVAVRTIRFLSYFTILTNGLVAAVAIGRMVRGAPRCDRRALPAQRTAVTVHILVVALIYHLLLRDIALPGAIGWWGNLCVHTLVPVGWTLCWLSFGPHGGIDRAAPWRWLLFPLGFAGWTLVHGAISGWYPYPFLDVAVHGYPGVLRAILLIGAVFVGLGYALRWVDARLAAKT